MMLSEYTRRLNAVSDELESLASARQASTWKNLPATADGNRAHAAERRLAEIVGGMGIGDTTANNTGSVKGNG